MSLTPDDLDRIFDLGHEASGIEFKPPCRVPRTIDWIFARIIRAAIGMANRRGGGHIVIGVNEERKQIFPVGLSDDELATWVHDDVTAKIKKYVAPFVTIELERIVVRGATYVVLYIAEFEEVPVLCDYDYKEDLIKGRIYVRSRGKPETSELPSQVELRELLDLATDRGVERFLRRSRRVGLPTELPQGPSAGVQFDRQLVNESSTPLADKIRSRGHWEITLRPNAFLRRRIPFEQLEPAIRQAHVSIRGWDFPHLEPSGLVPAMDCLRGETEVEYYLESWRLFESGQFHYLAGIHEDWTDATQRVFHWRPPEGIAALGPLLGVTDTIGRATEVFEFAGRLASTVESWEGTVITIALRGLRGRRLWFENPARRTTRDAVTEAHSFEFPLEDRTYTTAELLTDYRELGRMAAGEVFKRFGLTLSDNVLADIQREALRFGSA
jgi:hypothetical protein